MAGLAPSSILIVIVCFYFYFFFFCGITCTQSSVQTLSVQLHEFLVMYTLCSHHVGQDLDHFQCSRKFPCVSSQSISLKRATTLWISLRRLSLSILDLSFMSGFFLQHSIFELYPCVVSTHLYFLFTAEQHSFA